MTIYYFVVGIANLIAVIAFYKNINITALSVLPLFFIGLILFQATVFKKEKWEKGFRTRYGSDFNEEEENAMSDFAATALYAAIPLMIPFVLFFPSAIKFLSVLIYLLALIVGIFAYRIKNKNALKGRFDREESERREQEKKESLGKWK